MRAYCLTDRVEHSMLSAAGTGQHAWLVCDVKTAATQLDCKVHCLVQHPGHQTPSKTAHINLSITALPVTVLVHATKLQNTNHMTS